MEFSNTVAGRMAKDLVELGTTKTKAMNIMMITDLPQLSEVCNEFGIAYNEKDSKTSLKRKIVDHLGLSSKSDKGKGIIIVLDVYPLEDICDVHVMDKETMLTDKYEDYTKQGLTSEEASKYMSKMLLEFKTTNVKVNFVKEIV